MIPSGERGPGGSVPLPREQLTVVYLENLYRALYKHMSTEGAQ